MGTMISIIDTFNIDILQLLKNTKHNRHKDFPMILDIYDKELQQKGCSEATIRTYRTHITHYFDWLWESGVRSYRDSGPEDARKFFHHLETSPAQLRNPYSATKHCAIRPATRLAYYRSLHAFGAFVVRSGYRNDNPFNSVPLPRVVDEPLETYTKDEFNQLLDWMYEDKPRNHALFLFLYDTGCRLSEALVLQWHSIDLENQTAQVIGKRKIKRLIPMGRTNCKHLGNIRNGSEYVFPSRYDKPMAKSTAWGIMHTACLATGVPLRKELIHAIRHTAACNLLRASHGDIAFVKTVLGHTNIQTTMRYIKHLESERAMDLYKKVSPGDLL